MASTKGELDVTPAELDRLKKAFENEEFRKLFKEYAEEIADPENRKRYEEEISILERERGMDVKFVNPEPGYVIKTSGNGDTKIFINICKNNEIQKPSSERKINTDGRGGLQWSIPHSFSPPREDLDKGGEKCQVYDVVFHPDTYRLAETNVQFKRILHDTAFDGIEQKFNVKLDKKNFKIPKMQYKGKPVATVIRKKVGEAKELDPQDIMRECPYPYDGKTTEEKTKIHDENAKKKAEEANKQNEKTKLFSKKDVSDKGTKPNYKITHRTDFDMQNFTNVPDERSNSRPTELVIAIDLPLLKSASSVDLDIFEKLLILKSEKTAKYYLELPLPYPVDENQGSAKFDKSRHKLTITLPVAKSSKDPEVNGTGDRGITNSLVESLVNGNDQHQSVNGHDGEADPTGEIPVCQTDAKPLIEVLSSTLENSEENIHANNDETSQSPDPADDIGTSKPADKNIWSDADFGTITDAKICYLVPEYDFFQDNKTVTFILLCKKINLNTLSKAFPSGEDNSCHLKFASVGGGGFPVHYSIIFRFAAECRFEREKVEVDVSRDNVVVVVYKAKDCRGVWAGFEAGRDLHSMEERLFVTESSVCCELADLEAATMPSCEQSSPTLEVTDMNDNKLTIQIKPKGDTSPPAMKFTESGSDIEIVFSEERPKLHGILKQRSRTVSESSEEPLSASYNRESFIYSRENSLSAYGSESTISEGDEADDHPKKSVSFSSHVDHTMYKSGASVSALHATLKNKKKRQKKRDQRIHDKEERRRRRTSSGGSYSDSVSDPEDTNAPEDSGAMFDMESAPEPVIVAAPLTETQSDSQSEGSLQVPKGKKGRSKKNKNRGKRNVQLPSAHTPPETSTSEGSLPNGNSEEDTSSSAAEPESPPGVPASSGPPAEQPLSPASSVEGDQSPPSLASTPKKPAVQLIQDAGPDSDDDEPALSGPKDNGCGSEPPSEKPSTADALQNGINTKPPAQPDTELIWEEGGAPPGEEYKTQCAFEFQNSMMYDLDE